MIKIITVIGARPQFIKAAMLSKALQKRSKVNEIIVHTGQHYDDKMSSVFFEELNMPVPKYNLEVNNLSHGAMTGQMMINLEPLLLSEKPDWVVVFGDTNSTLAGALTAVKLGFKVAHIEAGLRSNNLNMPEEINRIITDRISQLLLCPTLKAIHNLKQEGFDNLTCRMVNTGDIMYDAAIHYSTQAAKTKSLSKKLNLSKYVLATIHRAENTDNIEHLMRIIDALNIINKEMKVLMPIHPRTHQIIQQNNIVCHFELIEPVGYIDMLDLIKNCTLVMTDSGGLQKEAYFFDKYCITLRNETEWTELCENGYNTLTGSDIHKVIESFHHYKDKNIGDKSMFYGYGNTAELIADELLKDI